MPIGQVYIIVFLPVLIFGMFTQDKSRLSFQIAICCLIAACAYAFRSPEFGTDSSTYLNYFLSACQAGGPAIEADDYSFYVMDFFFSLVPGVVCERDGFAAGVIALGLCFGAYATEVFRGAILAIPKGHREAGVALGLSKFRIFTRLIMPQMWRIALPGLGNLFMILMKDTALVSVIGLEEIMRHAQIGVTVTKQPFTFFMVAAFMYLGLTVLAMTGMHFLEKRAARGFARSTQ